MGQAGVRRHEVVGLRRRLARRSQENAAARMPDGKRGHPLSNHCKSHLNQFKSHYKNLTLITLFSMLYKRANQKTYFHLRLE
jgi:type II secretory pathway component PulL